MTVQAALGVRAARADEQAVVAAARIGEGR
jgi:hypothetical protein